MSEPESHLTEAQKQIQRLEMLRARREQKSKSTAEKIFLPTKTKAKQTLNKLNAMRETAARPNKRKKLDGKVKQFKLNALQTQVLNRLKARDKRLSLAAVTRIAINRLLDIGNSFDENELETRIFEVLREFNAKP